MSRDLADMAGRVMELVRLNLALLARVAELEAELALRDAAGAHSNDRSGSIADMVQCGAT